MTKVEYICPLWSLFLLDREEKMFFLRYYIIFF
nr:MAG TPA: hypothetical protein [Caudoviricetes sp.]